jgi:GABA permease
MPHRVIAVVTDELRGEEPMEQICAHANGGGVDVRVVVPAIEASPLEHTLGDVDGPRRQAEARLERALQLLQRSNVPVSGEVGDPDPVRAAQDALLKAPADEVLIFEHCESQAQWYDNGLLERAQEEIEPPLRMVFLESADGQSDHVVGVEETGQGTVNPLAGKEVGGGNYVPGMTRSDLAGMVAGIVGTIVVAILAAAVAADSSTKTGWAAVAILIAIGVALANLAHVVGLTIFESIRYRGGFAKFFRTLALIGTPLAIAINTAILIFAD